MNHTKLYRNGLQIRASVGSFNYRTTHYDTLNISEVDSFINNKKKSENSDFYLKGIKDAIFKKYNK